MSLQRKEPALSAVVGGCYTDFTPEGRGGSTFMTSRAFFRTDRGKERVSGKPGREVGRNGRTLIRTRESKQQNVLWHCAKASDLCGTDLVTGR